jgi:hypothetical protein
MDSDDDHFYIAIKHPAGRYRGFKIAPSLEKLEASPPAVETPSSEPTAKQQDPDGFKDVLEAFRSTMTVYQRFLDFIIAMGPAASSVIAERSINGFVKSRGKKLEVISNSDQSVFELPITAYQQLFRHREEIDATRSGVRHLPEVMLIGLISAYDAFLGKLLRVVFTRQEQLILTSEKTIKFSELSKYSSLEEARGVLIDREIETVLRDSHHEHFRWMEDKFRTPLRQNLPSFKKFVELCERRNLLTHTGGVVSAHYIANCKEFEVDLKGIKPGDELTVGSDYYREAVNVVCEIGTKLCYVLWRKFAKDDRDQADHAVNDFCVELIARRNYSTAEAILSFTSTCKQADRCRRMMVINHANAVRLQKRQDEAFKILDREDWSAVSNDFKICVAAVRGDVDEVIALMKRNGSNGASVGAEDYRAWPVFRGMRTDQKFFTAFEEVFGQALFRPETDVAEPSPDSSAEPPPKSRLH